MRSSVILLKVIFFVTLDSALMLMPEKVFKHFQVVVLIYRFFEKVWSLDFSAGNPTPDPNVSHRAAAFQFNQGASLLATFYRFVC